MSVLLDTADSRASDIVDPITLEILWSRLISIVDEAGAALHRTSFSTIVRESNDFGCAILDARGRSLAEATVSVPVFLGTMPRTLRSCLERFRPEDLRPGDVLLTNDPWMGTGHLHDWTLIAPVFRGGKIVAYCCDAAHGPDIGGAMWTADARELFEEGLRIVPAKYLEAGKPNEQLIEIIRANVRVPDQVIGDLDAQVAAAAVCERRLMELLEDTELELSNFGDAIQDRAEAAMRRAIETVPDGEYRYTVETDGYEHPLTIQTKITIKGSNLDVDFSGTSAQIDHGINSVYSYTHAYTSYALKCILDPVSPKNEGSFRPISIRAPEGTIVNPRFPAPVDARHMTGHYLTTAVFGALANVIPDRVIADSALNAIRAVYSGTGVDGQRYSQVIFPYGGMGARPNKDGLSCTPFPSNTRCGSLEVMESVAPLLFWKRELITDSGGPGRFRGGLGQEILIELISENPARVSILGERLRHPPLGFAGGLKGTVAEIRLNDGDPVPTKGRTTLKPGDRLCLRYPGAGGYGSPSKRDRSKVLEDLKNELISEDAARRIYGLESLK